MLIDFLHSNILWIILAFATLVSFIWLTLFKKDLRIKWYASLILAVLHTVIGVGCVKIFAILEGLICGVEPGSLSLYGGVFFMPIFYFLGAKLFHRDVKMVFDIFSFPLIFTLLCSRFNCLFNGCCLGLPVGDSGFRWPTREAEIVFYIILLIILDRKIVKRRFDGTVYPIYMIAYGIFRFIAEWFRESEHMLGVFHISHLWSILSIVIGAVCLWSIAKHGSKPKKKKKTK